MYHVKYPVTKNRLWSDFLSFFSLTAVWSDLSPVSFPWRRGDEGDPRLSSMYVPARPQNRFRPGESFWGREKRVATTSHMRESKGRVFLARRKKLWRTFAFKLSQKGAWGKERLKIQIIFGLSLLSMSHVRYVLVCGWWLGILRSKKRRAEAADVSGDSLQSYTPQGGFFSSPWKKIEHMWFLGQ